MFGIFQALTDAKSLKARLDDDFADRLNRRYTCALLFIFAAIVTMRSHFGENIHCWCDKCNGNEEKYINLYCWVTNTYYVPFSLPMPQRDEERSNKIYYYQWTPFIFVIQAVFFFLPSLLWQGLNRRSGINIGVIVDAARTYQRQVKEEKREKTLRHATQLLQRYLHAQKPSNGVFRSCHLMCSMEGLQFTPCGRYGGSYLTFWYFLIKLIYAINAVGQFFLLDMFLGRDFHSFGIEAIKTWYREMRWIGQEIFPMVTLCDFKVRQNTNVQLHTYQCLLPINMFNEKLFFSLWFWLLLVAVITAFSLLKWVYRMTVWSSQYRFIKRQLAAVDTNPDEAKAIKTFTQHYVRNDGILVLKLVSKNAGDVVATELLCGLFEDYKQRYKPGEPITVVTIGENTKQDLTLKLRKTTDSPTCNHGSGNSDSFPYLSSSEAGPEERKM